MRKLISFRNYLNWIVSMHLIFLQLISGNNLQFITSSSWSWHAWCLSHIKPWRTIGKRVSVWGRKVLTIASLLIDWSAPVGQECFVQQVGSEEARQTGQCITIFFLWKWEFMHWMELCPLPNEESNSSIRWTHIFLGIPPTPICFPFSVFYVNLPQVFLVGHTSTF